MRQDWKSELKAREKAETIGTENMKYGRVKQSRGDAELPTVGTYRAGGCEAG